MFICFLLIILMHIFWLDYSVDSVLAWRCVEDGCLTDDTKVLSISAFNVHAVWLTSTQYNTQISSTSQSKRT